ncbi:hypothetical protein GCM10023185_02380 [Hymenobacter saemangeumensis]|uniref:PepSY domain-containing protein n=1 Tax=Hymenobacter saemangeumensis TaxID=1084522 RepID=A0ABP8HY94_9BACT
MQDWKASRQAADEESLWDRRFNSAFAYYPAYVRDYKGNLVHISRYALKPGGGAGNGLPHGQHPASGPRTLPVMGAPAALRQALQFIGAQRYLWQDSIAETRLQREQDNLNATYRPTGELVTVCLPRTNAQALVWKFDVQAQQPRSRSYVYVDAYTGQVVLQEPMLELAGAASTAPANQP